MWNCHTFKSLTKLLRNSSINLQSSSTDISLTELSFIATGEERVLGEGDKVKARCDGSGGGEREQQLSISSNMVAGRRIVQSHRQKYRYVIFYTHPHMSVVHRFSSFIKFLLIILDYVLCLSIIQFIIRSIYRCR